MNIATAKSEPSLRGKDALERALLCAQVAEDNKGRHSTLVAELLTQLAKGQGAEAIFNKTRIAISKTSDGEQVPSVSSSLLEDIRFATADSSAAK